MSTPAFPEAFTLQRKLRRVLDNDLGVLDSRAVREAIDLLEVVKLIDSYTTVDTTANPTPALPGFPFTVTLTDAHIRGDEPILNKP